MRTLLKFLQAWKQRPVPKKGEVENWQLSICWQGLWPIAWYCLNAKCNNDIYQSQSQDDSLMSDPELFSQEPHFLSESQDDVNPGVVEQYFSLVHAITQRKIQRKTWLPNLFHVSQYEQFTRVRSTSKKTSETQIHIHNFNFWIWKPKRC